MPVRCRSVCICRQPHPERTRVGGTPRPQVLEPVPPPARQQREKAVEVSGEGAWWAMLRRDQENYDDTLLHHDGYEPRLLPRLSPLARAGRHRQLSTMNQWIPCPSPTN